MMKKPFITVMTSYYNDQEFLSDVISSVLAQTYTHFEYILVNHASTDKSREIAHSFKDPRIKHIDLPMNYGGSGNILIKKALEVARGEYLKIICADDMLRPNGLEILVKAAQAQNADLLFGNVAFVKADKTSLGKTWFAHRYPAGLSAAEYLRHFISGTSEFPYAGNFVKISALRKVPMDYVSIQLADVGLWVSLLFNGAKLAFSQKIVADYRIHPRQISSASKLQIIGFRCLLEHFLYCKNYLTARTSVKFLQKIFPQAKYLAQLTEQDRDFVPFAVAHALYETTNIPACILACRLKLAEILNNYELAGRIEKKFGYTLKDLRDDIVNSPINLLKIDPHAVHDNRPVLKNAPLKEMSYFYWRRLWFTVSGHEHREKRRQQKRRKQNEIGIV